MRLLENIVVNEPKRIAVLEHVTMDITSVKSSQFSLVGWHIWDTMRHTYYPQKLNVWADFFGNLTSHMLPKLMKNATQS